MAPQSAQSPLQDSGCNKQLQQDNGQARVAGIATPSPTAKQKSSIWKRIGSGVGSVTGGSIGGKKSPKHTSYENLDSSEPPSVAQATTVTITTNGKNSDETFLAPVHGHHVTPPRRDRAKSQESTSVSGSHHHLSFSEQQQQQEEPSSDDEENNYGLIIQEVTQTSFVDRGGAMATELSFVDWTPFEKDGNVNNVDPSTTSSSKHLTNKELSPKQLLFNNSVDDRTYGSKSKNSSPAEPPITLRKTLIPEFFSEGRGSPSPPLSPDLSGSFNSKKHTKKRLATNKRQDVTPVTPTTTTTIYNMKENTAANISSSNMSYASSSSQDGGHLYAEIYLHTKPKTTEHPPNNGRTGVGRYRSDPSLAMTTVSSLSGRSTIFGTVHAQDQQMGWCDERPSIHVTPECSETARQDNIGGGLDPSSALSNTENYFDYVANTDSPLSPQGVSPHRNAAAYGSFSYRPSDKNNTWKSRANRLWKEVAKNTCRCFGEPCEDIGDPDSSKLNKLSSTTTAATATTAANTSTAAAQVGKLKRTPMFSSPVDIV